VAARESDCLECGRRKPTSEFSTHYGSGLPRPYCKDCNAEKVRLGHYNITREFLDRLWSYQGERCAVCEAELAANARSLHIDHDHACCAGRRSCGECVRGLVCSNCNVYGLAWYEGLPKHLRTFALLNAYLEDPPARRVRSVR
jgi:hypothetical protein